MFKLVTLVVLSLFSNFIFAKKLLCFGMKEGVMMTTYRESDDNVPIAGVYTAELPLHQGAVNDMFAGCQYDSMLPDCEFEFNIQEELNTASTPTNATTPIGAIEFEHCFQCDFANVLKLKPHFNKKSDQECTVRFLPAETGQFKLIPSLAKVII